MKDFNGDTEILRVPDFVVEAADKTLNIATHHANVDTSVKVVKTPWGTFQPAEPVTQPNCPTTGTPKTHH